MPELGPPSGAVAFLFTDIEGSTRRWERQPAAMSLALVRHDELLRVAIERHNGRVFKTVGDAFCAAFATVAQAGAAALDGQRALAAEPWGETGALLVRMALHRGDAEARDDDYFGPTLNRVARLLATGHGGQILLSRDAHDDLRGVLPPGAALRDLGGHRLKDLTRPERIFQLVAPDLPDGFPPLTTLDAHPNNLPAQPTPLVGRRREVAAARELLAQPDVRLVTLTGPGGTGKTRLGLQVAAELVDAFADGAWFVPLTAVRDPELVGAAIAGALAVREVGGQPLVETLIEELRDEQRLLLLDNFEQVTEAAPLVARLLAGCPDLKVLVTSRAALRVSGEHELPVPPLALPPRPGHGPTGPRLPTLDDLIEIEAIRLFADRARAVKPDFAVTAANAEAVAAICHRLDGLPLAIELAAARVRLLPPPQLLKRLDQRLPMLTGGARDLPARQQTLRGAIDWSHDLLTDDERALFARLAVFAGGATLDAAEIVCEGMRDEGRGMREDDEDTSSSLIPHPSSLARPSSLDALAALVDQSLLRQEEPADDDGAGEPRVSMLETIREYASERLEARGEGAAMRRRHAAYFAALAEAAEPALAGAEQIPWLDRLEIEHDNLRAALAELARHGDADTELRMARALWRFWQVRGHLTEGRGWLTRALARGGGAPATVRARALDAAGALAEAQGDCDEAAALHEEALRLQRELGDRLGCARSMANLGVIEQYDRGNYERAQALQEAALALFREVDDRQGIASTLHNLADVALRQGEFEHAAALFGEGLARSRALADVLGVSGGLNGLGVLAFLQQDYERAAAFYEESLPICRDLGDVQNLALTLGNLGEAVQYQGDQERAEALHNEALTLCRELGDKQGVAFAFSHLAQIARRRGEYDRAAVLFRESIALCQQVGDQPRLAECVEGLAGLVAAQGDATRAARLFGAAEQLRETIGVPIPTVHRVGYDRDVALVRAALDPAVLATAWAAGQALPIDAVVSEPTNSLLAVREGVGLRGR